MKLYPTMNVTLNYQNFGSAWLGILRGTTDDINTVFNGLFNLRGTNGELEWLDNLQVVGTFWTSRRALRRFFFNRYFLARCSGKRGQGRLVRAAMRFAHAQLESLSGQHENCLDFENRYMPETYASGTIRAERPDVDMKDAILYHAFSNKEVDIAPKS